MKRGVFEQEEGKKGTERKVGRRKGVGNIEREEIRSELT